MQLPQQPVRVHVAISCQFYHGAVGMHRIPKTLSAGTVENLGVYVGLGGSTLVLTPDSKTRRSCIGVSEEGTYLLDPAQTGHAFMVRAVV